MELPSVPQTRPPLLAYKKTPGLAYWAATTAAWIKLTPKALGWRVLFSAKCQHNGNDNAIGDKVENNKNTGHSFKIAEKKTAQNQCRKRRTKKASPRKNKASIKANFSSA